MTDKPQHDPTSPSPADANPDTDRVEPRESGDELLGAGIPLNSSGMCLCGCGQLASLATETKKKKGWVKGQPLRFIHGHHGRRPLEERLHEKLVRNSTTGCLVWTGSRDQKGYGRIWAWEQLERPHRVAFLLAGGQLSPEKPFVLHRCDNPSCCEPSHLFAGSAEDNGLDMARKGRGRGNKTGLPLGVYRRGPQSYSAHVSIDRKLVNLGSYGSIEEASAAVVEARKGYLG